MKFFQHRIKGINIYFHLNARICLRKIVFSFSLFFSPRNDKAIGIYDHSAGRIFNLRTHSVRRYHLS